MHRASPGCVQISWPSPSPLLPFFLPFSCPLCPPFPPRSLCPALPLPADPRGDPYILIPVPTTAPADPRADPYILINQGRPRSWDVHGSTHDRRTPALTLAPPVAQAALQPASFDQLPLISAAPPVAGRLFSIKKFELYPFLIEKRRPATGGAALIRGSWSKDAGCSAGCATGGARVRVGVRRLCILPWTFQDPGWPWLIKI